jgi:hypothetical protein
MILFNFIGYTTTTLARIARIGWIPNLQAISILAHICDTKLKCRATSGLPHDNMLGEALSPN